MDRSEVQLGADYGSSIHLTPNERLVRRLVTGDPERDFEKLCRIGCVDGHVDNPDEWRSAIRKLARQAGVKLTTVGGAHFVVAITKHYEEWFDKNSARVMEESLA